MAGDKVKPEDLFESLKIMNTQKKKEPQNLAETFFSRFSSRMTEDTNIFNDRS